MANRPHVHRGKCCRLVERGKDRRRQRDPREICRLLTISLPALRIYTDLFFNVVDRRDEPDYIRGLVYPETRRVTLKPDYLEQVPTTYLLRRVAFEHGLEALKCVAGFPSPRFEAFPFLLGIAPLPRISPWKGFFLSSAPQNEKVSDNGSWVAMRFRKGQPHPSVHPRNHIPSGFCGYLVFAKFPAVLDL